MSIPDIHAMRRVGLQQMGIQDLGDFASRMLDNAVGHTGVPDAFHAQDQDAVMRHGFMGSSGQVRNRLIINDITIPPGYRRIGLEEARALPPAQVRFLDPETAFHYDATNPQLNALLEIYSQQTRELRHALKASFADRDLPICLERHTNSRTKYFRRMNFLLRPPLFLSGEKKGHTNRLQDDPNRDVFVLHFDETGYFHRTRMWVDEDIKIYGFRVVVNKGLIGHKELLSEYFGQWEAMATIIADVLEKHIHRVVAPEELYKSAK